MTTHTNQVKVKEMIRMVTLKEMASLQVQQLKQDRFVRNQECTLLLNNNHII